METFLNKVIRILGAIIAAACLFGALLFSSTPASSTEPASQRLLTQTPTPLSPTSTPTLCPQATPVAFFVNPVTSPTDYLAQTIDLISGGDINTIDTGFAVFTSTLNGVDIVLELGKTHRLTASTYVEERISGGCSYGGYTLRAVRDINGESLIIVQSGTVAPSPTPTDTPTPANCPTPSPVPFSVNPVTSPTDLLTQTIRMRSGGGLQHN